MGTLTGSTPGRDQPGLHPDELLALERLLSSRTLQHSPRVRPFLKFIVDARVDGRLDDIREQNLGCCVFGRPPGYNHAEDNIVRVTARQLRAKIDEYYRTEGEHETCRVEIAKGTYVPTFRRIVETPTETVPLATPVVADPLPSGSTVQVRRALWFGLLTLAGLLLITAIVLSFQLQRLGISSEPPAMGILRLLLPAPGRRLNMVLADSSTQLYYQLSGRDPSFAEYVRREYLLPENLPKAIEYRSPLWQYLMNSTTSDFAAISSLTHLLPVLPKEQTSVRHASQVTTRDFLNDNAILVSSAAANPWVSLFEGQLNFQIQRPAEGQNQVILNRNPLAGEARVYDSIQVRPGAQHVYCRIALIPNLSKNGWVLLLSGPNSASIEAASSYLADATNVEPLLRLLHVRSIQSIPAFELVLEATTTQGIPNEAKVVAHRVVPVEKTSTPK